MSSAGTLGDLREGLGLSGIVVTSPLNTQFLTGCLILTQRLLPDRLAAVVSAAEGEAFVVCDFEERQARQESTIEEIRTYKEFASSPIDVAARTLRELGGDGTVGFESRHLPAHHYLELTSALPGAQFVPIDLELSRLRAVKTSAEIDLLRAAFIATDAAIAAGFTQARPGESTKTMVKRMKRAMLDGGADDTAFAVIGAAADTLDGHPVAGDTPIPTGAPVRTDFGGHFRGYYTDLARSAFFGEAGSEQADSYRRLWAAFEDLLAAVQPGAVAGDLYAVGQNAMTAHGLETTSTNGKWEMPHVGHGIGLEVHEYPVLEARETARLEPGMIVCLELMYTKPGEYRLHVEDAVLVTDDGSEILSRSRDWSEPLAIGT